MRQTEVATMSDTPRLDAARAALAAAEALLATVRDALAQRATERGKISNECIDRMQQPVYEFALAATGLRVAGSMLEYAANATELETRLAVLCTAEALHDLRNRLERAPADFGLDAAAVAQAFATPPMLACQAELRAERYTELAAAMEHGGFGQLGLGEDHEMIRETFRRFAEEAVAPLAESVHRDDLLVPESILDGLREMGCFGLSIPQRYDGFQDDERPDNMGMILVTEELSRGSLGIAGSLVTRPEILAKALLKGGTEEQKRAWLPLIASGEKMVSVCVTEPDYGSDVAGLTVTARPTEGGWLLNGVKTWATFAGRAEILLVLARTDPDPSKKHAGLSMFIAEKPASEAHAFEFTQPGGGRIEGRAIPTIGYRGMHSYEVAFEDYFVPAANLVGGEAGLGRGFYLQMEGFAGGRLQTAARANGVMQAALDKAWSYAHERSVFGKPVFAYGLTQWKLARMAMLVMAARQFTYAVARLVDTGQGIMESSMAKLFASRTAEWVTREAQQIHGGMGYAEEYAVSRYFVDARVFSIFEGAEEVLALRVLARALLETGLEPALAPTGRAS
jgi:(2S)-methylsuccinyl-CoA dehydrogenase